MFPIIQIMSIRSNRFLNRTLTNMPPLHMNVMSPTAEAGISARPFKEMPGPQGLPIIGNLWRFFPIIGEFASKDFTELQKALRCQYGNIVRLDGIRTRAPWVLVMDPLLIEQVLQQQGPWPRRHSVQSLEYYQNVTRREWFGGKIGTITTQGKERKDFRSKVNPYLMRPQAVKKYAPLMNDVASDFVIRLKPTVINNMRNVQTDNYILDNYRIPNGAFLFLCHMTLSNLEENFQNAEKFIPERWIKDQNGTCEAQKTNPYVYMPFGYGVRMCIGKRFANMETEMLILKIIQNYRLEYNYSDVKFQTGLLQTIKSPLHFKIIDR